MWENNPGTDRDVELSWGRPKSVFSGFSFTELQACGGVVSEGLNLRLRRNIQRFNDFHNKTCLCGFKRINFRGWWNVCGVLNGRGAGFSWSRLQWAVPGYTFPRSSVSFRRLLNIINTLFNEQMVCTDGVSVLLWWTAGLFDRTWCLLTLVELRKHRGSKLTFTRLRLLPPGEPQLLSPLSDTC